MEERIDFMADQLQLDGLYCKKGSGKGAVIAHPHPLYGGDMNNPVVESLASCFNKMNISTLRFNFRGVGESQGSFGGGIDEQGDIIGAIDFLQDQGISSITLVGYSFGSWVLAHMKELPGWVHSVIFVSPPVAFMPFGDDIKIPNLRLVITGEEDEIAPPDAVQNVVQTWNLSAQIKIIDYADHFYYGNFVALEKAVADYLAQE